jgi:hypothetical protein
MIKQVAFLSTLAVLSGFARASLPAYFDFEELSKTSDYICIAQLTSDIKRISTGPEKLIAAPLGEDGDIYEVKCKVLVTLQGTCPEETRIQYGAKNLFKKDETVILFLKQADKIVHLTKETVSEIHISSYAKERDSDKLSVKDRIQQQLLAMLEGQPSEIVSALQWLDKLGACPADDKLRTLSKNTNDDVALAALELLAKKRDRTAIAEIGEAVTGRFSRVDRQTKEELAWILAHEVPDSVPVEYANKMVESDNKVLVHAGCEILSKVGDDSSVPFLIKAMRFKEVNTSYYVLSALGKITGTQGPEAPRYEDFVAEPEKAIHKWELWWEKSHEKYESPEVNKK